VRKFIFPFEPGNLHQSVNVELLGNLVTIFRYQVGIIISLSLEKQSSALLKAFSS
jgi:hypothetical protein